MKLGILVGLLLCILPLCGQASTPAPLAQQLRMALAADLGGPEYRTKSRSERVQGLLQEDERAVKKILGERLAPDAEGWIACPKAQRALQEGMETTQTVVGIEVLLRAAFAVQVQCSGSVDLITLEQGFGGSLQGALRASSAALPAGLSQTYTLISQLTPGQMVSGVLGDSSQTDEMKCSASALYRERRRGSKYMEAEGLVSKECEPPKAAVPGAA